MMSRLNGFQFINCYIVLDIEMDLHRKACLMVEDNMTQMLDVITKSLCIALMMAGLHDLEVKAADVLNAYVTAPNHEKV